MAVSLAPDPATAPVDPTKPRLPPVAPGGAAPLGLAPAPAPASGAPSAPVAPLATPAPLPTEYPSAPSTTGTPQNRLQLATTAFDTFAKSTAPQYTADLRQATQEAAGKGTIGSGGLRTTYGNLANQRALALDTERSNLVNAATTATIGDQQAAQGLGIQQQNADTSRFGTVGNLGLATTAQADQNALGVAGITGTYTAPGGASATPTLSSAQLKIEQQNADTASAAQKATAANEAGQLGLATKQTDQANAIAAAGLTGILNGTQTLAAKQQAVEAAVAQGQLTVEQGKLALASLANTQQNTLATAGLTGQIQTGVDADGKPTYGATLGGQQLALQKQQSDQANAIATAGLTGVLNGTATLQAKQDAVSQAVAQGSLTVEQGKLALANLANTQQNTLATAAQEVQSKVALGQLTLAQASQALDEKVKTGELTIDQAKQALDQINSEAGNKVSQQNADTASAAQKATATNQAGQLGLAKDTLTQNQNQFIDTLVGGAVTQGANGAQWSPSLAAQQLGLAKDQLAQAGTQFGLTQSQNLQLAKLADATQNRQIDVSTTQGQNALLLQLANILGSPGSTLNADFVQTIMKALGIAGSVGGAGPSGTGTGTVGTSTGTGGATGTGGTGTGGGLGTGGGTQGGSPLLTGQNPDGTTNATQLGLAPDPNAFTGSPQGYGDPSALYQPTAGTLGLAPQGQTPYPLPTPYGDPSDLYQPSQGGGGLL